MTPAALATRRRALGLRQIDLAATLGVHRRTVEDWERGIFPIPRMAEICLAYLESRRRPEPPKAATG